MCGWFQGPADCHQSPHRLYHQLFPRRSSYIGVARGCSGCTCTPRADNLQGKLVSAPISTPRAPPGRARVNFRTFLLGGGDLEVRVVHLVVLDRLLRVSTKKGRQLFWGKKQCTPQTKSWLRLCRVTVIESIISWVSLVFVPWVVQLTEVVMQPVSIRICILTLAALLIVTSRLPSQPTAASPDHLGNCLMV